MTDSPISALDPASLPLSNELVPCVQGSDNKRVSAAAFGIPIASTEPPAGLTQYQLWIDESTDPPTLNIYLGSHWKPLYAFDSNGVMTFSHPVGLAEGDDLTAALIYKGLIDCSADPNYLDGDQGDFYVVSSPGKIGGASGNDVDVGDTLLCLVDGSAAGDQATVGMNWTIGQGNIDGAVTGPASAADGDFAQFDGTTGKIIKDGLSLDVDGTLSADSDTHVPSQKAVKTYVDSVAQGLDVKPSVKAASTSSLTHSGAQTIDGVSCVVGDRVLDKNNSTPALNGIWIVASGSWARAADMDSWSEIPGAFCFVEQGTVNGNTGWTCTSDQGGTLETTAITWTQFSGAGTYTAGSGLSLSGMQFSAVIGSGGGSEAWSAELDAVAGLSTTGLVARTGAHTYATRAIAVPAGMSINNPDGVSGNPTLLLANDLAALEALGSTGIAVRIAADTWAQRSLSQPAAGLTISSADGVSGNPTFGLANDLAALEGLTSTGIAARTGADSWAQRTLTQPAAGLTVSNADGSAGNPTFALANDLAAVEALSATGIAVRTATDTWAQRTLTAPAAGLTISNSGGVAGNPTFALANDLAALEGLASTGIAVRTTTDTWTQRAITGTSGEIGVTNGDGVSGAPTIGLPSSLTFTAKTITGGTFSSPAAITGLPDPTNAQDAATKNYVDSLAQGLDVKPSVKAASTTSLTHSGLQTIDGVSCVAGDRVLDKNNSSAALNGIWIVASVSWTRAADMDSWSEIPGAFCFVEQGTVNGNAGWVCTADQGGTLGTTAIPWVQFAGVGTFTAGSGLSLVGTQFSALIGSSGGSEAWSTELDALAALSTTGLVARTGAHTYNPRSMSAPAAGLTITNPDGVSGNPTFALANDLSALEGLSATGLAVRTAADTWAQRSLTQPAAGLTLTNSDGVAGNPTFALANDLAALEGLTSTGIAVRTATDTWTQRTLTQPTAGLTVANPDGVSGNPTFALANDLAALEALGSIGIAVRTGVDSWAQRAIAVPTGMTINNPDGVSGNPTLVLANDLAALEGLASTGIAVRTGTDVWTQRAITGTSAEIAVTNGDGVSGAPTIGLPSALTFTSKTVTGGTFSSPTAITGLPDPTNAQDAATKNYVDTAVQGQDAKPSVKAASTTSLTHTGAQTIDGVPCVAGDRVLDKDNSTASLRGIWVVASVAWTRAADMDSWSEIPGAFCFVEQGTANADTGWLCTADQGGTLGTTAITWTQFAGPGAYEASSAELDALAALSTTGLVARTGAHTYVPRAITVPAGMTINNPDGVSGNPTLLLANDLAALEGLSSTGIAVRTAADTWTQRAIAGTSGEIAVTNGDGVGGAPTIGLPSALTFTSKTVTGGTFSSPAAITGLPDPSGAQDAATKNYVDTTAQGLDAKPSVKVATPVGTSLTHSGLQTIDGVSCIAGDRVLDKNNISQATNGIWIVASGSWIRATDMDSWSEIPGSFCFVEQGTVNANTGWLCTSGGGGTLGSTSINWTQFAGPGAYEASSAELDALAGLSTTGIVARTGAHAYTPRTITGTSAEIAVTNGDGVGGAPTIGLPGSLTFTSKTVTGGTFSSPAAITGLPDPSSAQDAATKNYVDTNVLGLDLKPSVKAASTTNIAHSGTLTIDGVACVAGDRVLDKDNTNGSLRGIWIVASGIWSRAADMNSWSQVPGAFCFVEQGTVNGDTGWLCTADQSGSMGTTAINWTQFAGPGTYTAGSGLSLSGSQFSAVIGSSGGSEAWSAELDGLATLNTTGLVARTGTHTYAARAIAVPAGMSISNPTGAGGNPTISLANDLAALENLSGTNNVYYRSATDTWSSVTFGAMLSWSGGTLNVAPSIDTTLGGGSPSDGAVSSQKAVQTYAKANIGGQAISTDTLGQGQGWVWDGQSSTFKACDVRGENELVNSAFEVWQAPVPSTFGGTATKTHIADFWKVGASGTPSFMASKVGGVTSPSSLKLQRISGQSNNSKIRLAQQFAQTESMYLSGKTVTVSFDYTTGANYSPTTGPFIGIYCGGGVDEDLDLHAGSTAFATSPTNVLSSSLNSQVGASGTTVRIVTGPLAIPGAATELALVFFVTPVGTAGFDDSFTIGNVKMELGNIATPYRKPDLAGEFVRCQRRYQKSFFATSTPLQGNSTMTGEARWRRFGSGTASEGTQIRLFTPMRSFPAITLYNPVNINGQVYNETTNADCSAAATQNVYDGSFEITCTGNSGGSAGDWLGVHWTADARL